MILKRFSLSILMLAMTCGGALAGAAGNIGTHDNRRYGSLEEPEYSAICHMYAGGNKSHCTCGFIDEHLVISNSHCVSRCIKQGCSAKFWNGKSYVTTELKPIMYNKNFDTLTGNDWAFFFANDANPNTKKVAASTTIGQVNRGGYGTLRVIPDDEISALRPIVAQMYKKHYDTCKRDPSTDPIVCVMKYVNKAVEQAGLKKLTGDTDNFKVQTCNITKNAVSAMNESYPNMAKTDCDSGGGDSGAPLFRGDTIVGLNNSGPQRIFQDNDADGANAVKTQNFYKYLDQGRSLVADNLQSLGTSGGSASSSSGATPSGGASSSSGKIPPRNNGSTAGGGANSGAGSTSSGTTPVTTPNPAPAGAASVSGAATSTTSGTTIAPVAVTTPNPEPGTGGEPSTGNADYQQLYQQYLNGFQCD